MSSRSLSMLAVLGGLKPVFTSLPHAQVRFVVEGGRVLIEKEPAEGSPGSEGLQRLRRARLRTRLSTDEATSLHRLIRDEILGQARQPVPDPWPLPDRGGQGWHRIVATALHLPGGTGGRPRTDRQLFQCGSGKRYHQPWVG